MGGFLGLAVLVLDIIAMVDAVKSPMGFTRKALWIALIAVLPIIGIVLYFLIEKKNGSSKKEG